MESLKYSGLTSAGLTSAKVTVNSARGSLRPPIFCIEHGTIINSSTVTLQSLYTSTEEQ